jgi:hypothetical protein
LHEINVEMATLRDENAKLRQEQAVMQQRIDDLVARTTMINNSITINDSVINLCAYGEEPLPDRQEVRALLRQPESSITRYVQMKHFRQAETSNMRISNKKSRTMQVIEKDANDQLRWMEKDKKRMIEKIVEDNLEELVDTHGASNVANWKNWYHGSGLSNEGYDATNAWKQINVDVHNMLLSQREHNVVRSKQEHDS